MRLRFDFLLGPGRNLALIAAAVLTAAIGALDQATPNVSLGFLYLFPILMAAPHLDRLTIAGLALLCDILREQFGPYQWGTDSVPRSVTAYLAYVGVGLFGWAVAQSRRQALDNIGKLNDEIQRREAAEEQVRSLVEGSPAALLTVNPEGRVVLANSAARELLQCTEEPLEGQPIDGYLPTLAEFRNSSGIRHLVRTMVECTGYRAGGEAFLAQVWVSSSGPPAVTGLTALVFDASEQLRSREEGSLHALALNARVILGEYWHEIRNLSSAMRMAVLSLMKNPAVTDVEEVTALNSLVRSLEKAANAGLYRDTEETYDMASLRAVLDQFRIIVEPWFEEAEATLIWKEMHNLPLIRANHQALLQVFLNLARNARRALQEVRSKEFEVSATTEKGKAVVRFRNSGPPIANPSALFQAFQPGAEQTGLGLHVARALVRSFGGDLRYEAVPNGCCFTVVLEPRRISEAMGGRNS
jgi:two-component system sensor kinase FixL